MTQKKVKLSGITEENLDTLSVNSLAVATLAGFQISLTAKWKQANDEVAVALVGTLVMSLFLGITLWSNSKLEAESRIPTDPQKRANRLVVEWKNVLVYVNRMAQQACRLDTARAPDSSVFQCLRGLRLWDEVAKVLQGLTVCLSFCFNLWTSCPRLEITVCPTSEFMS